jgi:GGDEF domain-containing protein
LQDNEDTSEGLLAKADAALYRAKSKGRNCVSD